MPLALIKYGLTRKHPGPPHFCWKGDIKKTYDIVIIGAGGHGLATAYYLATRHGITNVAVLDKGGLGGGNMVRNSAITSANCLTPEGVAVYKESVELFRALSYELDMNIMYSERGHITLAHTDAGMRTARWCAEINKHMGVSAQVMSPGEIEHICPLLNVSEDVRYPVRGALYQPKGAIASQNALIWGYAKEVMKRGLEVHKRTEVTKVLVQRGRAIGVETNRGTIYAGAVLHTVAGSAGRLAMTAGVKLPCRSISVQACVSEPVEPILDQIVVSDTLHVSAVQSPRGDMVLSGATEPYTLEEAHSSLDVKVRLMGRLLELFPFMGELRALRHWTAIAGETPDHSPIVGPTPVENFAIDIGWGSRSLMAAPVAGLGTAEYLATGTVPEILKPFALDRFRAFDLVNEKGSV